MKTNHITLGLDLGDKKHAACALDGDGRVMFETTVSCTQQGLERLIDRTGPCRVALEAGTHSPWVSRLLESWGCETLVANPRRTRAIWDRVDKSDGSDAQLLARLARADSTLLSPIRHRGRQEQAHLAVIKARHALIGARTSLITHARGIVKSFGARLPQCDADSFARRVPDAVPVELRAALEPVVRSIAELTEKIKHYERTLDEIAEQQYPETAHLRSVYGVGPLTALAYVLTLEDPARFAKGRSVGPYLGLTPRRDQSGQTDKQLPITKAGDGHLRWLLVQCAHRILGPHSPDSALRRAGLRQLERGGTNAKKRAVVAVARKLAVVLHCLWSQRASYEPFPQGPPSDSAPSSGRPATVRRQVVAVEPDTVLGPVKGKPLRGAASSPLDRTCARRPLNGRRPSEKKDFPMNTKP
jgi:transposase